MDIHFSCEKCGHPIDVADRFAGKTGHCKHCGHPMTVPGGHHHAPSHGPPPDDGGLRLRPATGVDVPDEGREARHAPRPDLAIRPLAPEEAARLQAAHARDLPRDKSPIGVLDPYGFAKSRGAPHHLSPHYETRLARFVAKILRILRDWLYVISLGFLLVAGIGFLFGSKGLLHLGAVGVVATNILMLVDGVFYLLVLPFRDSLMQGLMTLLPPYAVYYWVKNWGHMKKPVINTLRSFTPIFLVGTGYFFYEEWPWLRDEAQQVEKLVEEKLEPGQAPKAKTAETKATDEP